MVRLPPARVIVPLVVAFASLCACEGADGDMRAVEGTATYEAGDGGFRVDYLSPPWVVATSTDESVELEVPAVLFGVALEGSDPTHVFQMAYVDASEGLGAFVDAEALDTDTDGLLDGIDTDGIPPDAEIPVDTDGDPIPDYLRTIDLRAPGAVALAELDHLIVEEQAQLDEPLRTFVTRSGRGGMVYQVVLRQGVFVRSFYFPAHRSVVRAVFVSIFDLETSDIEHMAKRIHTGGEQEVPQ